MRNQRNHLGKAATLAAVITGLVFALESNTPNEEAQNPYTSPSKFEDVGGQMFRAMRYADKFHGGVSQTGGNRDYSGDGKNDLYVVAQDGTIFYGDLHSHSRIDGMTAWSKLEDTK